MSCVAAPIPATGVDYGGFRLLDLDFERRNERILGLDENVIRLPFEFQPDSELRGHLPLLESRHMSHSRSRPPHHTFVCPVAISQMPMLNSSIFFAKSKSLYEIPDTS